MPNNTVANQIEIFNFSELIDADELERLKGGKGKFLFLFFITRYGKE